MFSKRNLKRSKRAKEDKPLIMLVDDEEHNLIVMRAALEDDFEIIDCNNGAQALQKVESMDDPSKITVIVCDQRMPGISGIEFFNKVKEMIPDTIRILFTAYTDMKAIIDSINKANIYKFITKPILPPDLLMTVTRAAELHKMQIKIKENEKLKGEFIATISHELLTPMNGIYGGIELIKMDEDNSNKQENVNIIENSAYHMMGLIRSVLDFTLLQSGMNELQQQDVDINTELDSVLEQYREKCSKRNLQFDVSKPDIDGLLHTDIEKLKVVVSNLLSNAVKFTSDGRISFEAKINEHDEKTWLHIEVEDTGIGIDENIQSSIFEIFKQADGSFSRQYGGLGMGLSLVKRVVELFNGTVSVQSEVGKGSKFTVELPVELSSQLNEPNPIYKAIQSKSENTPHEKVRALVVEDNRVNQLVLKSILQKFSCDVYTCDNGLEAVNWTQKNEADIIFMDCQMPIMDGFEASEKIRSEEGSNQYIPIVAVTANVSDSDKNKCQEVGMNLFIPKPIRKQKIAETLNMFLGTDFL